MTKKIIYFTAGPSITTSEATDIAALQTLSNTYNLFVRNGAMNATHNGVMEACDYVAGTVPSSHSGVALFGAIDAARPVLFTVGPAVAISGVGTKQLTPIAVTGTDLSNLVASILTANVTYVSSVPGKATVSAGGLITGVSAGTTVITATYTFTTGKTVTSTTTVTVS